MINYSIIFASVFERHYFSELFFYQNYSRKNELKKSLSISSVAQDIDLRLALITWNMGGKKVLGLQKMDKIVDNFSSCDVIAIACQECKRKDKYDRTVDIEKFMVPRGFVNIDATNQVASMYEMFLLVFIKRELSTEVSKVEQTYLAKGFGGFVGNKGGIAYSFTIKNRLFNFIACHLRHGQAKEAERN